MPKFRVFYTGPTEWDIEAADEFLAEQEALDRMFERLHTEEIEDEEIEK